MSESFSKRFKSSDGLEPEELQAICDGAQQVLKLHEQMKAKSGRRRNNDDKDDYERQLNKLQQNVLEWVQRPLPSPAVSADDAPLLTPRLRRQLRQLHDIASSDKEKVNIEEFNTLTSEIVDALKHQVIPNRRHEFASRDPWAPKIVDNSTTAQFSALRRVMAEKELPPLDENLEVEHEEGLTSLENSQSSDDNKDSDHSEDDEDSDESEPFSLGSDHSSDEDINFVEDEWLVNKNYSALLEHMGVNAKDSSGDESDESNDEDTKDVEMQIERKFAHQLRVRGN